MKKMMFILMIMTAFLAGAAFAVAPDDVTNPSFEDGTAGVCDNWTLYSGGGALDAIYHEGDAANAHSGEDYFEVGPNNGGWQGVHTSANEEVAVVPGTQAEMVFWAKTADGSAQAASVALKFEFYATQGEGWAEGSTPFAEAIVDTGATYQAYSVVAEVPAGMNYARCTVVSQAVAVYVDDVWAGVAGESGTSKGPSGAVPANGSIQSVLNTYGYSAVTALSWTNPAPLVETDTLGVQVKFGVGAADPNFPGASSISGTDLETVALSALSPAVTLPLADDTSYYWQVILTDPNGTGTPVVTEGNVWTFETGDALPLIDTVAKQYMWLDQDDGDGDSTIRTFTVTTSYTDDGKSSITDANHTTTDWLWVNDEAGAIEVSDVWTADAPGSNGELSGTVVATYRTVAVDEDPLRPLGTNLPGWWKLGLEVSDQAGARMTQGETGINYVGENCGQAATAEGDPDEGGDPNFDATYDVNSDCINNFADFSEFALNWLAQSPKFE